MKLESYHAFFLAFLLFALSTIALFMVEKGISTTAAAAIGAMALSHSMYTYGKLKASS